MIHPPSNERHERRWRRIAVHALRIALFVVILLLIHDQHRHWRAARVGEEAASVTVDRVRPFLPDAHVLGEWRASDGGRDVLDASGDNIGHFLLTSPESDGVVGYSGPTNVLMAFDASDHVRGIAVLSSGDTPDHVDAILGDEGFMQAFDGMTRDEASRRPAVDAVSGATLTSLAIVDAIAHRLSGAPPMPRFTEPVTVEQVKPFLSNVDRLVPIDDARGVLQALDAQGQVIGTIARTSPAADTEIGYQGPTDTLLVFDAADRLLGMAVRRSFDNEPYVGYVRDETSFLTLFNGKTIDELASLDLKQAQVEGVSGATMTSMAVARGIVRTAKRLREPPRASAAAWRPRVRDVGTAIVVLLGLVIALSPLHHRRWVRVTFQVVLVAYVGFINGDMLSQAIIVGWAQSGVAWRSTPGLALLAAVALVAPMLSRHQVYCHHLCPHGAAQQWLHRRLPWQVTPPKWLTRVLEAVPVLLLAWVALVAMRHLPVSLVDIEPFDAYVVRAAGWATLTIAVVGLVASAFVPMAYCRFGCPTGAMLGFLRYHGRSDRLTRRDAAALALVAMVVVMRVW